MRLHSGARLKPSLYKGNRVSGRRLAASCHVELDVTNNQWFEIQQNKDKSMKLFTNKSSGFIQSTIIYIPIFLCDSGIGKHLKEKVSRVVSRKYAKHFTSIQFCMRHNQ